MNLSDIFLYRFTQHIEGKTMAYINKRIHERILEKKKRLDSYRPLPPSLVTRLREQLIVEYTYASNAIEGNTLSLRETRLVIEEGITIGGKSLREHLEAKNHPEAIFFIEELVKAGREIDEEAVLSLHIMILQGIDENAGQYRTWGVRVTGAAFTPPRSSEIRPLMGKLLQWLRGNPDELTPIELATVFHHRFAQIHPFSEGNGRAARLLMNAILMRYGYPFIVNISYGDRARYLKTFSEADLGNLSAFVNFIAASVEHALDVYLHAIEEPEILTLAEAGKISPYTQGYLSLLARRGLIGAFKRGRNWVITREDLERYVKSVQAKKKKMSPLERTLIHEKQKFI